jgi:uncharacterized protein (DUF1501 family)
MVKSTRRNFLSQAAALGCLGCVARPHLSFAAVPDGLSRNLIVFAAGGGWDGCYVLPYRDAALWNALHARRPALFSVPSAALTTVGQVLGNQSIGLHPKWNERHSVQHRSVYDLYQQNRLVIISRIGSPTPNGSHDTSQRMWSSGKVSWIPGQEAPWYSKYLQDNVVVPFQVWNFRPTGFGLGPSDDPFPILLNASLDDLQAKYGTQFGTEMSLAREALIDATNADTTNTIAGAKLQGALQALEPMLAEAAAVRSEVVGSFPTTSFGKMVRDVAKIISHYRRTGLSSNSLVIQIEFPLSFDTHGGQTLYLDGLIAEMSRTLGALVTDLERQNVWNRSVIAVVTEFGRQLSDNGSGTDHGWGNNLMVLGGGVRGSSTHGIIGSPPAASYLANTSNINLDATYDFRQMYSELFSWAGLNPTLVLQGFQPGAASIFG